MNLVDALRRVLPTEAVVDDPDLLASHRHDHAGFVTAGWPAALARPTSTAEVQHVVRVAADAGTPIVPRGAGSGLSGGANAVDGCIVLSLERMDAIVGISVEDRTTVVQPGVLNGTLTDRAEEHGLTYPPDPASAAFSTIGGNIATNAGGLCCLKYGVTRDHVLGLEVVLADGRTTRTGSATVKSVAGYDLTGLFVGSEGTLGVVTEATLRLRPAAAEPCTLVAVFPTPSAAAEAVAATARVGVVPSLFELMDNATVRAVDDWTRMGLDRDAGALLVARSDAGGERGQEEMAAVAACCEQQGATFVARSEGAEQADQLLDARRLAFSALERCGDTLLDDVAVPLSQVPALLAAVEDIAGSSDLLIGTFGHVSDGNMHPTVVYDRSNPEQTRRAYGAFEAIIRAALHLGGTITGEHGVGSLKQPHLTAELDPAAYDLHRAIKRAFDPAGLLNPGKVLPASALVSAGSTAHRRTDSTPTEGPS